MTGWALYMLAGRSLTTDKEAMRRYLEEALPIFVENEDKSGYALLFDGFATLVAGPRERGPWRCSSRATPPRPSGAPAPVSRR